MRTAISISVLSALIACGSVMAQSPPPPKSKPKDVVAPPIATPDPCTANNTNCSGLPPEWTPRLYATVPTLMTSGVTFERENRTTAQSLLTYKLYQINTVQLNAGNASCCHIISDNATWGSGYVAHLQQGLCFVLSQEPSMSMAEMNMALGLPTVVNGAVVPSVGGGPPFYGTGVGGTPNGPGCAYPPPTTTPAQIAAAYTIVYVN